MCLLTVDLDSQYQPPGYFSKAWTILSVLGRLLRERITASDSALSFLSVMATPLPTMRSALFSFPARYIIASAIRQPAGQPSNQQT